MRQLLHLSLCIGVILAIGSCYSLKGTSIPSNTNTFFVDYFEHKAFNAPPDINQVFTERLKDKIRSQSRLDYSTIDPDIEFSGAITSYLVTSEAPTSDEETGLNRIEIRMKVKYQNHVEEEDTWESNFMYFYEYAPDLTLDDVQDEAHTVIFAQIAEDIFNKAFYQLVGNSPCVFHHSEISHWDHAIRRTNHDSFAVDSARTPGHSHSR